MAHHFYHIPLQKTLHFIKTQKSILHKFSSDSKMLLYYQQLGKAYYTLEIESFIDFFKIDKSLDYALKTIEYFNSSIFIEDMAKKLNFSSFDTKDTKALFYIWCYVYNTKEPEAFEDFIQKTFLHYHTAFNQSSNISINHQEICHSLAKSRKQLIKESFGESGEESFFKLFLNDVLQVEEKGKRIKTLRKKAYKKLFYILLD